MIHQITNKDNKEWIAEAILKDLPEWFGLPESTQEYITESRDLPFVAYYKDDVPVGFAVIKETSKYSCDIFVMGVLKKYHGKGIGRKLYEALELLAKRAGYEYMQVKTVQSGIYKEYDATNEFYRAMGFRELEVFPELWDPWNPCQIYIKYIGRKDCAR